MLFKSNLLTNRDFRNKTNIKTWNFRFVFNAGYIEMLVVYNVTDFATDVTASSTGF